jgi:outer membrane protein TolC
MQRRYFWRRPQRSLAVVAFVTVMLARCCCESAWAAGDRLTLADGDAARIAELEAHQAQSGLGEERSAYLPQLFVTSGAGYSNRQQAKLRAVNGEGREKVYGLRSLGSSDGWVNVELEQLLFDLGSWHRIEQRALAAEAARIAAEQRRDVITRDVLAAYTKVLRLDQLRAVALERAGQARWLEQQAARLLGAGRAVPTEREQASVVAGEASLEADMRAADLEEARGALRVAVGDPARNVSRLDPASVPRAELPADDLAADQSLAATPALQVLDLRKRVEERGLAAARAGRYPTVGMQAGYSNYGPNRYDNYPDEVSVNVALRVPIFDGTRTSHAVAGASAAVEIAERRYRMLLEQKRVRVRELADRLATGRVRGELADRRADLGRERVRLSDLSLQAERGSLGDGIAARDAFARDAAAAVEARWDRLDTWADLMLESGRLTRVITGAGPDAAPATP